MAWLSNVNLVLLLAYGSGNWQYQAYDIVNVDKTLATLAILILRLYGLYGIR